MISNRLVCGILLTSLTLVVYIQPVNSDSSIIFFDDFNDGVADGWTQHLGTWSKKEMRHEAYRAKVCFWPDCVLYERLDLGPEPVEYQCLG